MPSYLIVWSNLNNFPANQPAATNSMHLQSTWNPHLQYLFNQRCIWNNLMEHLQCSTFVAEIVDVFGLLSIFAGELHSIDPLEPQNWYLKKSVMKATGLTSDIPDVFSYCWNQYEFPKIEPKFFRAKFIKRP